MSRAPLLLGTILIQDGAKMLYKGPLSLSLYICEVNKMEKQLYHFSRPMAYFTKETKKWIFMVSPLIRELCWLTTINMNSFNSCLWTKHKGLYYSNLHE